MLRTGERSFGFPTSPLFKDCNLQCPCILGCISLRFVVLPVTVITLLVLARRHGVNLSALGIGVDFLQVISMYVLSD